MSGYGNYNRVLGYGKSWWYHGKAWKRVSANWNEKIDLNTK